MKTMKKLIALLLVLLLSFSVAFAAAEGEGGADDGGANNGQTEQQPDGGNDDNQTPVSGKWGDKGAITISGYSESGTYAIYRMLDLQSYDTAGEGLYYYTVNSDWTNFFAVGDQEGNGRGAGADYLLRDTHGIWNWQGEETDERKAQFAKLALVYAEENDIDPEQRFEGNFNGTFSDLELGYYLIDSNVGALCGLTTTNPHGYVNAKNNPPTIDKQVEEDSTQQWGDVNSADIGQVVNFRTTINVHEGAENFVLHDKMSDGLSFYMEGRDDLGVTQIVHVVPGPTEAETKRTTVPAEYYTVVKAGDTDDQGNALITDGCTFEVRFTQAFCDHLETNDKIVIYYSAMLNRNAVVGSTNPDGKTDDTNPNESWLDYGDDQSTTHDKTDTKTYFVDLVKTDGQNKLIDGAAFRIYNTADIIQPQYTAEMTDEQKKTALVDANKANEVAVVELWTSDVDPTVVKGSEADVLEGYRRARNDEKGVEIVVTDGFVRLFGFDNGTYYLHETETPEGYSPLTGRQSFRIADGNLVALFPDDVNYSTGSGVQVVNRNGGMLPETGGIGTTLFYMFGGVLAVAAVVLLVTKKRMDSAE